MESVKTNKTNVVCDNEHKSCETVNNHAGAKIMKEKFHKVLNDAGAYAPEIHIEGIDFKEISFVHDPDVAKIYYGFDGHPRIKYVTYLLDGVLLHKILDSGFVVKEMMGAGLVLDGCDEEGISVIFTLPNECVNKHHNVENNGA